MFKKISVIAAGLLAVVLVGGASLTSAGASGVDPHSDLCVIATRVDDPSITAQVGNCAEPTPEPTVEEPASSAQKRVIFIGCVVMRDIALEGAPYSATMVNQKTGEALEPIYPTDYMTGQPVKTLAEHDGRGEIRFNEVFMRPDNEPLATYKVTLSVDGKTYSYVFDSSVYEKQPDDPSEPDVTTYVAEAYAHLENGVLVPGYGPY